MHCWPNGKERNERDGEGAEEGGEWVRELRQARERVVEKNQRRRRTLNSRIPPIVCLSSLSLLIVALNAMLLVVNNVLNGLFFINLLEAITDVSQRAKASAKLPNEASQPQ